MSHPPAKKTVRHTPWWVHVLIAGVVYAVLAYWIPTLHSEDHRLAVFLEILPSLAPIGAIAFLLLGAKALYDLDGSRKKLPETKVDLDDKGHSQRP